MSPRIPQGPLSLVPPAIGRVVRAVLRVELRQLARDRRALFAAILLPALLYPLMFGGSQWAENVSRDTLAAREVKVALDWTRAAPDVAAAGRALLEQRTPIQVFDVDAASVFDLEDETALDPEILATRRRDAVQAVLAGSAHVLVTAEPHPTAPRRTLFQLYYGIKADDEREARSRAEDALRELEESLARERRGELLGADPGAGLELTVVDVASAEATSGAALGRILPFLAVLVLISGGAYAALAVFAGEREAGTLETLLVQPVPTRAIAWGKFLAVLTAGLVTLACNLGSLVVCVAFGIGEFPGVEPGGASIGAARLLAGLAYLPGCVLLCAILCLVCGRARTFREGQMTLLPITLLTALPSAIVLRPEVELSYLWAIVPFAGPALAMSDGLRGQLALGPLLAMIASHAVFAGLALARLTGILDAERILRSESNESEASLRHAHSRHALRWGFVSVLALYVVGGKLQQWNPEYGLALTLWGLVLALALACAYRASRRARAPLTVELGLTRPRVAHVLGAVLLVPGLVSLARWYLPVQQEFLPLPRSMTEAASALAFLDEMPTWKLVFLLAISPAICEELLFRGALLSSLKRDLSFARVLLWEALFFAAAHASVYRIVPTAFLGALLAAVTLRARGILPAVLVHAGYNGLLILGDSGRVAWTDGAAFGWLALGAPAGVALLALPARRA